MTHRSWNLPQTISVWVHTSNRLLYPCCDTCRHPCVPIESHFQTSLLATLRPPYSSAESLWRILLFASLGPLYSCAESPGRILLLAILRPLYSATESLRQISLLVTTRPLYLCSSTTFLLHLLIPWCVTELLPSLGLRFRLCWVGGSWDSFGILLWWITNPSFGDV